jgi:ribose-phosphate pyrophosphokinase
MTDKIKIFAGSANKKLAAQIAKKLQLGPVERTDITTFSDGEIRIELKDSVRGCKAYIIQSTCSPANDTLMELVLLADALRRSSVREIIAIVPYFGYARQDRRPGYSRVPISARIVADMMQMAGIDHVVTVDIHATQIQGFFHIPVDNISAMQLFVADIYKHWMDVNPIIVSPDVGGVARARSVAKLVDLELAIVDKRRQVANISEVMHIIGDVTDKTCIMIDDLVDTAGTLGKAADALIDIGARHVVAYATHGVLSGKAKEHLTKSRLTELVITDTIPRKKEFEDFPKLRVLSISNILAETIHRINDGTSIGALLD